MEKQTASDRSAPHSHRSDGSDNVGSGDNDGAVTARQWAKRHGLSGETQSQFSVPGVVVLRGRERREREREDLS